MSALWVVPHKGNELIGKCVQSIKDHHTDPQIVTHSAEHNSHYGPGAFRYAFDVYGHFDFYYFVFDSLLVHANLDFCQDHDVMTVRWFDSNVHGWGWNDDTGEPLDDWARDRGVQIPKHYRGIMGPMLMAPRAVIEKADLFRLMPTNRYEQCALERCWGIWLEEAGYDVTNSLQGEHKGHFDPYPDEYVTKLEMHRA